MNTPQPQPRCFRTIRVYKDGRKSRTLKNHLTEAEAQAHCQRPETKCAQWFDGYDYMKGCRP